MQRPSSLNGLDERTESKVEFDDPGMKVLDKDAQRRQYDNEMYSIRFRLLADNPNILTESTLWDPDDDEASRVQAMTRAEKCRPYGGSDVLAGREAEEMEVMFGPALEDIEDREREELAEDPSWTLSLLKDIKEASSRLDMEEL